jgi:hypothetical protein
VFKSGNVWTGLFSHKKNIYTTEKTMAMLALHTVRWTCDVKDLQSEDDCSTSTLFSLPSGQDGDPFRFNLTATRFGGNGGVLCGIVVPLAKVDKRKFQDQLIVVRVHTPTTHGEQPQGQAVIWLEHDLTATPFIDECGDWSAEELWAHANESVLIRGAPDQIIFEATLFRPAPH